MRRYPLGRGVHLLRAAVFFLFLLVFTTWWRFRHEERIASGRILVTQQFPSMGTVVEVKAVCPPSDRDRVEKALLEARDEMEGFIGLINTWVETSEVSAVNRGAGRAPVPVSPPTLSLLASSVRVGEMSGGAFDVTVGPLLRLWRLKQEDPYIPTPEEIASALPRVDYRALVLDSTARTAFLSREGMRIDLGGIAKGTAIDVMGSALRARGVTDAYINAGGGILCLGHNEQGLPWRVGIRNPRGEGYFEQILHLTGTSVATSGDYERMIIVDNTRYHHILDPRTGTPVTASISATVTHPSGEMSDALATAVFVLGPEKGIALLESIPEAEGMIIDPELRWHKSSGFDAVASGETGF